VGTLALDAVEVGCIACERNQCDGSLGYDGSPDENCDTTLDAILDGTSTKSGAVAALRRIRNAIALARHVLEHTTHTPLVGDCVTDFFHPERFQGRESHNGEKAKYVQRMEGNKCQPNYRLNVSPNPSSSCAPYVLLFRDNGFGHTRQASHDTLSIIALHSDGSMAAGTTTNGASHKTPGRVGDGPITGSGSYVDGDVGGCGVTSDGDNMMRFLPCYQAVENLRRGMSPTEAAEDAVRRMLRKYPDISSGIVVVHNKGEHGAAESGWTFIYVYRGEKLVNTSVVRVPPVEAQPILEL
jgi:N4-(beta-N-acetylglucosaminyl)-L-asparaginase